MKTERIYLVKDKVAQRYKLLRRKDLGIELVWLLCKNIDFTSGLIGAYLCDLVSLFSCIYVVSYYLLECFKSFSCIFRFKWQR